MPVILPKLDRVVELVTINRRSTQTFAIWWQKVAKTVEDAFLLLEDAVLQIQVVLGIANSKNKTFRQTTAPTASAVGDLWVDTDDGNKLYRWSGSEWVVVQDDGAAYARNGLNPDGTVATGKVTNASLQVGAVLTTPGGNVSSSTTLSSSSTWFNCGSVVANMSGVEAIIRVDFDTEVIDNCKFGYRLMCDGVTLGRERGPVSVTTLDEPGYGITRRHTPSAGARTYTLECSVNDANDIIIHDPVFDITENRNV